MYSLSDANVDFLACAVCRVCRGSFAFLVFSRSFASSKCLKASVRSLFGDVRCLLIASACTSRCNILFGGSDRWNDILSSASGVLQALKFVLLVFFLAHFSSCIFNYIALVQVNIYNMASAMYRGTYVPNAPFIVGGL